MIQYLHTLFVRIFFVSLSLSRIVVFLLSESVNIEGQKKITLSVKATIRQLTSTKSVILQKQAVKESTFSLEGLVIKETSK